MHWLDITILSLVGFAAVWGLFTGFLWQLSRIVSFLLGVYCGIVLNDPVSQFVQSSILEGGNPTVARLIAFGGVFLTVCLVLFTVTMVLNRAVQKIGLQWLNRLLGGVLGAVKAAIVLSLVIFGLTQFPGTGYLTQESKLADPMIHALGKLAALLPDDVAREIPGHQAADKREQEARPEARAEEQEPEAAPEPDTAAEEPAWMKEIRRNLPNYR